MRVNHTSGMTISRSRNFSLHIRDAPLPRRRIETVQRVARVIVVAATELEFLSEYKRRNGIICPFIGAPKIEERNTNLRKTL